VILGAIACIAGFATDPIAPDIAPDCTLFSNPPSPAPKPYNAPVAAPSTADFPFLPKPIFEAP